MTERPRWNDLTQVEQHLSGALAKIVVPLVRGQPVAPYAPVDATGLDRRVTIAFTSFGFPRRAKLLIDSIAAQRGVRSGQIEVRCVGDVSPGSAHSPWLHLERVANDRRKTRWLHRLAERATGDVMVFTDADAVLPPWFCANVLQLVQTEKLYTSVRKDLPFPLAEILLARDRGVEGLDWVGLREAVPDRWSFDWVRRTPSGFLHIMPTNVYRRVGGYEVEHVGFDAYDWDFASRVFHLTGEPILVPDLWTIHLDHPRGADRDAWFESGRDL